MITWCIEEFGTGVAMCAATPQAVDTVAAIRFLQETVDARTPLDQMN